MTTAQTAPAKANGVVLAKPLPEPTQEVAVIPEKRAATKARVNRALLNQQHVKGLEDWAEEQARTGDAVGARSTRREIEKMKTASEADLDHWSYTTRNPQRGNGNELVPLPEPEHPARRDYKVAHVEKPATVLAHQASSEAMDMLADNESLAIALDLANDLKPRSRAEQLLIHQAATLHKLGMGHARKAKAEQDRMIVSGLSERNVGLHQAASLEAQRQTNAAGRAFSAFNEALLTLAKLRTGGKQSMTVIHKHQNVNVAPGGQAVVAQNMRTGKRAQKPKRGRQ